MASTIDPTKPTATSATTESVRANFQAAKDEIEALQAADTAHLSDTVDAHDASAISNVAAGGIIATDVQAAINELDTEKTAASTLAASGGAALVGNLPAGDLAATTVQAALNELDTEKAKLAGLSTQDFDAKDITASGGIYLGGTATANLLDDYEESTFTPTIAFGGASVGITYSINTGTYTKIGNSVRVNLYITLSNVGSSTGAATIEGLPFTVLTGSGGYSTPALYFNGVSFADSPQGFAVQNTTRIDLQEITNAGAAGNLLNTDFTGTSSLMASVTYPTSL